MLGSMRAKRRKTSILLTLVVALGAAVASAGCVVHARAYPTVAPPPPQYVEVDYRPGYTWIEGRWVWRYNNWHWQNGYWVAERPGYYYSQGYWSNQGGRHVWVGGSWKRGHAPRGVRQRDHRRPTRNVGDVWKRDQRRAQPPPRRDKPGRVIKRDHRTKKKEERKKKDDKPRIRKRDHR